MPRPPSELAGRADAAATSEQVRGDLHRYRGPHTHRATGSCLSWSIIMQKNITRQNALNNEMSRYGVWSLFNDPAGTLRTRGAAGR